MQAPRCLHLNGKTRRVGKHTESTRQAKCRGAEMVVEAQQLLLSEASAMALAAPSSPAAPSPSPGQPLPTPRFHTSQKNALYGGSTYLI